ncbi:DUF4935 domain-containing protein [Duganella sp. LX20W]|uniref:DUF4935 domain-containing protein n=1 Tax=Rugamonas brunnea TaxID=2758569 RepID=A0A7W2EVR1_9BURK|nr:PIN domain-containing protein [Rugamonas brunnea]MBA5639460.1 DUF4935 domain-containing protein [Rugamonas brunnea]
METFDLVIDTSMLRRTPFLHPDFQLLLRESQKGTLKIHIPHIALEEERTHHLKAYTDAVAELQSKFAKLQRGMLGMIVDGLPKPIMELGDLGEVTRNSQEVFKRFVTDNKIEVIDISEEQAANAWARFFDVRPPFNPNEPREQRRKDIPDSWILEAAIEIKPKKGIRCALIADNKLAAAFEAEGFKVYKDVATLLADIEQATAVAPMQKQVVEGPLVPLDQLRSAAFKNIDVLILGLIEALNTPSKDALFATLEAAGYDRAIVEHEAQTLVLSGRLTDTGSHLLPTSRALAKEAAGTEVVIDVLLKVLK